MRCEGISGQLHSVVLLLAAWAWLGIAHAQPVPDDFDPGKNRAAANKAAAEQAAAALRQAESERKRREAAEAEAVRARAKAAELEHQLAEAQRKAGDAANQTAEVRRRAAEAQRKVGAGGTVVAGYAPLAVFRDTLKDGSQGPEMIVIPAGSFEMGSNLGDPNGKPMRTVRIAMPFALGKTEVTQAQWRQVMGSDPPELRFKGCNDCPVESVNWDDVQDFIRKLNALTGKTYRLPSEAEWEYAAKADGNSAYSGGNDIDAVAWYVKNSGGKTNPVGRKSPNAWGLYDMSGNVWEWVEDSWHDSYRGAPTDGSAWVTRGDAGGKDGWREMQWDGSAWVTGSGVGRRVLRGGGLHDDLAWLRAAYRNWIPSTKRGPGSGFRLVRMLP
jgi:formylglycine-generating enzyme required for sulfatase activity